MGDPRKVRKKYSTPTHPWQKERIEEEIELLNSYGLKNKREIWKTRTFLKKFTQQAKKLVAASGTQAELEKGQLLNRLSSLGIIEGSAHLEDVLTILPKDVMERRLQTLVFKKNLSRSLKQARQFITHRHILINDQLITAPSYLVTKTEEAKISFITSSALNSIDHAERAPIESKGTKKSKSTETEEKKEDKKEPKTEEKKSSGKNEKSLEKPKAPSKEKKVVEKKEEVKEDKKENKKQDKKSK